MLAEVAYRRGQLASAEAHARAAATVSRADALAVLLNIMLDQGRLDEAQRLVEPYPSHRQPTTSCCSRSRRQPRA